jgi:hypothetical protein
LVPACIPAIFDSTGDRAANNVIGKIRANTGTRRSHNPPVADIFQDGGDVWPVPAHAGFDRVYLAELVPENAIAVLGLGQNVTRSGQLAETVLKFGRIHLKKFGDDLDIGLGYICTPIPAATITAHPTFKQVVEIRLRRHGGFPGHV